jgi:hypothetical protein
MITFSQLTNLNKELCSNFFKKPYSILALSYMTVISIVLQYQYYKPPGTEKWLINMFFSMFVFFSNATWNPHTIILYTPCFG